MGRATAFDWDPPSDPGQVGVLDGFPGGEEGRFLKNRCRSAGVDGDWDRIGVESWCCFEFCFGGSKGEDAEERSGMLNRLQYLQIAFEQRGLLGATQPSPSAAEWIGDFSEHEGR